MGITQFLDSLTNYRDTAAVVYEGRTLSYERLLQQRDDWLKVLASFHIPQGACVAFMGEFCEHMVSLSVALIQNNNILVPIITEAGKEYGEHLDVAEAEFIISFDEKHDFEIIRRNIHAEHALITSLRDTQAPGLILFTSGSTGKFKASVHSLPKLLSDMQSRPPKPLNTLVFLLLDHIGGFNTLLNILVCGGTAVFTQDRSAETVCQLVEQYKIQLLPTTPTFINMLLISGLYKTHDLSSLRLITYGTEPMPDKTLAALHKVFPNARLKQTYGLTETGIIPTKSESNASLWVKVGGDKVQTKVIDGRLWVKTDSVMLGYLNAPSPFDDAGWLDTGDMVEEKNGYFRILGRESEIINVGGEKVYPVEVETVVQQVENVKDVVVYGKRNPILGEVVVARVAMVSDEDSGEIEERVRTHCKASLAPFKVPAFIEVVAEDLHNARFKKARHIPKQA